MSGGRFSGTFWPTRREQLVLVAALADEDRALGAWQELRHDFDLQTTEELAFAALPLVFLRLQSAGVDDPDLARLKGIYRSTWAKNTLLVDRLRATAEAFQSAEVPVLLVGSVGSALRYYETLGLRPTGYVELLVSEDDLIRAVRALGSAGWSTRGATRQGGVAPLPLFDDAGGLCLLRTSLASDFARAAGGSPEEPFWDAAAVIDVNETPVRALSPTDDLLAAIVTGARAHPVRSVLWIVDAAMILRAPEQIDWERLCRIGVERGQGLRLRDALEYLHRLVDSSAPPAVRERLDRRKPPARERLIYASTTGAVRRLGPLPQALGEHLSATTGRSAWATTAALPRFFRDRWNLDHTWQVPVAGGQRALRAISRRRVGPADPR
jgi:hypothetical protein